ncbi:MAG: hypothetical protein WA459_24405 [Stellaceae bacterium]
MRGRKPHRLTHIADPLFFADRQAVAIKIIAEGGTFDLEIPAAEIGTVVQFLVGLADHVGTLAAEDGVDVTPQAKTFSPIRIRGVGFATGATPAETLLVVRLAGFDLAFSLDREMLADLSRGFSRIAQTLSADPAKRQ